MKKLILLSTLTVFLYAGAAQAGIVGGAHDFSTKAWANGDLCEVCHTPHNASPTTGAPLWNHDETTSTFTVYANGGTLDSTPGQPTGVSKLCLSCHDGTVALDSYGGNTGAQMIGAGSKNFGTDISGSHPVAITYDAALALLDGELYDPTTQVSGLGGTIANDMLFSAGNNQVECASCHDVHGTGGFNKLLVMDNTTSTLCLTCHNK